MKRPREAFPAETRQKRLKRLDVLLLQQRLDESKTVADAALLAFLVGDFDTSMELTAQLKFLWTLDVHYLLTGRNGERAPMARWTTINRTENAYRNAYRKLRRALAAAAAHDDAMWRRFVALGLQRTWSANVADVRASFELGGGR